jgi:hypothetical protein
MDKPDLNLFQRDGVLVSIQAIPRKARGEHEANPTIPRIVSTTDDYIREHATQAADWYAPDRRSGKYKLTAAPGAFAKYLRGQMSWPFKILSGITLTPTLRRNGSVITEPGYDAATGLYYYPSREYPSVPESPTWDDARNAYTVLCEPFKDFPFVTSCHHSGAISGILTIVARHLIYTSPLFAIRSNVRGSGKGLLVNTITIAATGREAPFLGRGHRPRRGEKETADHCDGWRSCNRPR